MARFRTLICLSVPPRNQSVCLEACRKYVRVFKFPHARMQHTQINTHTHKHTHTHTNTHTGTHAGESGLREGDVIVEVEGRSLAGVSSRDAAHALAGPSGSYVLVSVRRQDTHKGTVVVTTHLVRDVSEDNAIEATFAAMGQAKDVERFWKQLGITCNDKMEHQLQEARIREMHSQRAHMVNVRLAHRTQEKDLQIPTLNRARLASSCFSSSCLGGTQGARV
jgi:hypothetical protein